MKQTNKIIIIVIRKFKKKRIETKRKSQTRVNKS